MVIKALFDNLNVVPSSTTPTTSSQATFDNLNVPPGSPTDVTGLTATLMGFSSVGLQWTKVAAALDYTVTAVPAMLVPSFTTTGNAAVITGLTASTQYVFTVKANNTSGSSAGVTVTVTTSADTSSGGTVAPPTPNPSPVVVAQPTGQAFPSGYAFRAENFGKTAAQVSV